MKAALIPVVAAFVVTIAAPLQAEDMLTAAAMRLKADLSFLASDELAGRDVGSEGIAQAGEFIADKFSSLGLKTDSFDGTPFQDFTIPELPSLGPAERNTLRFSGRSGPFPELTLGQEFTSLSLGNNGTFEGDVVFAGYGITAPSLNYDDYAGIDVKGKVVIVLRKEPQQAQADSVFDGQEYSQHALFSTKELNAALHGVAALLLVNDSASADENDQLLNATEAGQAATNQSVPTLFASRAVIDPIVQEGTGMSLEELERAIDSDLKPRSQVLDRVTASGETLIKGAKARNVIGVLPGTGNLADEYVVVGAHYDHVGMGGRGSLARGTIAIHNGADDNASGTTALIEVARRLAAETSENRRSIVFIAFTAEEKGLLGSEHYVRNPRFPLESTVAMINMDMVGRLRDNKLTVFGTGTAKSFDGMLDSLNESSEFLLEKQAAGFGPSDHSSFYEVDIPVLHFFTGLHNQYHRPSDDIDLVNFQGMARITDMITGAVKEVATLETRPEHVSIRSFADVGRSRARPRRAVLGIQLDLDSDVTGVSVSVVDSGSPAGQAGIQKADVITRMDDLKIQSLRDLRDAMRQKKPGDQVEVTIKRGGEEVKLPVTLGEG